MQPYKRLHFRDQELLSFPGQVYPEYLSDTFRNALLLGTGEEWCVSAVGVTLRVSADPFHVLGQLYKLALLTLKPALCMCYI